MWVGGGHTGVGFVPAFYEVTSAIPVRPRRQSTHRSAPRVLAATVFRRVILGRLPGHHHSKRRCPWSSYARVTVLGNCCRDPLGSRLLAERTKRRRPTETR